MSWVVYALVATLALGAYLVLGWLRAGRPRNIGDQAPQVRARAARHGKPEDFDLYETLRTSAVVLYFFPQAFTAG